MIKEIYNRLAKIEKLLQEKQNNEVIYLDIDEASEFLKMKKSYIYQLVFQRKIPFYKRSKKLLFKKSELVKWIDSKRVKTMEELADTVNMKRITKKTIKGRRCKMETNEFRLITGNELDKKEIQEPEWVIKDLLPPGLCILAGAPKSGKSILAFNLAIALSNGVKFMNHFECEKKKILLLPYEDNEKRLQKRQRLIKAKLGISDTSNLILPDKCFFPRINEASLRGLEKTIDANKINVIIIDTLATGLLPQKRKSHSAYFDEYEMLNSFQRFALKKNISLIMIHHTRKMKADNVFDEISGTRGISGAADMNIVLERNKYTGRLYIQGRDVEDQTYEMIFEKGSFVWRVNAKIDEDEVRLTPEQNIIYNIFKSNKDEIFNPNSVAKLVGKENIRPTFGRLVDLELIKKS